MRCIQHGQSDLSPLLRRCPAGQLGDATSVRHARAGSLPYRPALSFARSCRANEDRRAFASHAARHRSPAIDRRLCDGVGIIKWNDDAASVGKKLFRMPIGSRDNCFSRTERDGECAGNDLSFLAIGSDVDVRRAHVLDQLLGLTKRLLKITCEETPSSSARACSPSLYRSPSRRLICGCVAPETMYTTFSMLLQDRRQARESRFRFLCWETAGRM